MDSDYSEKNLAENSSLNILQQELGWKIKQSQEVTRTWKGEKSPLLLDDLSDALIKLNPWINNDQINEIISKLEEGNCSKFNLRNNKSKYYLIRDGINVTVKEKEQNSQKRALLIDFNEPENNLFTAVSQLRIKGEHVEYLCKPDLLGFVNGIPLLFFEFKSLSVNIENAYIDNYKKYLEKIPQLFTCNAFCVFSNIENTKIGATGSKFESFDDWPRLEEGGERSTRIENFLRSFCKKENLLDLFENFILFPENEGKISKIIARNHQFLGVNKAFKSYLQKKDNAGKLGTFWHTQGSGKSLSMLFFAEKIKRKCEGAPVFVILTDRRELDRQIYDTFVSCGVLGEDRDCIVESKKDLEKKLKEKHRYIFSLIHKFGNSDLVPIKSEKEILIIADEAHRTQYGQMAEKMHDFLPNASKIGFTGTPLLHDNEKTARRFGGYVSQYDLLCAVEDKVTVPLIYENRVAFLKNIKDVQFNEDIANFLSKENLTIEEKNEFKKLISKKKHLWMAEDRLRKNAQDFVIYYSSKLNAGKALYVCLNRLACVLMFNFVKECWNKEIESLIDSLTNGDSEKHGEIKEKIELMKNTEMEIVVSNDGFDEEEILKVYGKNIEIPTNLNSTISADQRFKDKDNNLRIVFVCAMWLTGFDVKCLSFLFLDKPLKAHTLMQAIARPNRKFEGKKWGVIVDYLGLTSNIVEAINKWNKKRPLIKAASPKEIIKKIESIILEIEKILGNEEIYLSKLIFEKDLEIKAKNLIEVREKLLREDIKAKFNRLYLDLHGNFKVVDHEVSKEIIDKFNTIKEIYKNLNSRRRVNFCDLSAFSVFEVCQRYLKSYVNKENFSANIGYNEICLISDLIIDSNRIRNVVNDIRENLEPIFWKIVELNPVNINVLNEYNKFINEYNKSNEPEKLRKIFQNILYFAFKFSKEKDKHKEVGLPNIQSLAVYEICKAKDEEAILNNPYKAKELCTNIVDLFREKVKKVHNFLEKESTKSEMFSLLREEIFKNHPRDDLSESELEDLTNKVFSYLRNVYERDLLYLDFDIRG